MLDHSLPEASGYSLRTHNIILEQQRRGWSTYQLTGPRQGSSSDDSETVAGLTFFRTASSTPRWIARAPFDFVWTVHRLRRRLRSVVADIRPDVIHAHSPCSNGLAALRLGYPLVYEMRTLWEDGSILAGRLAEGSIAHRVARGLETLVLRKADAVITISDGLRAEVLRRGVPGNHITVVPNAVDAVKLALDPSAADRRSARQRFSIADSHVLGYVGSLFAWEGLELLLRALLVVRAQRRDVGLLVVGGGPQEKELAETAKKLGVTEHVTFTGRIPHKAAIEAYNAIDLLVYPRLPMRLTDAVTPLKPLEAMALGKPLVASDVGGHRELVRDRETGVLFRAGDCNALAAAILDVLSDESLRSRLVERGIQFVRQERSWEKVVESYEPVYRSLIAKTHGTTSGEQRV